MPLLRNDIFYCDHLGASERDRNDVQKFSVKDVRGEGLVNYIRDYAFEDEARKRMRTYLVRSNNNSELVGYFSLKAGLISFNEGNSEEIADFDTLPGIELANFAVNNEYQKKNPGSKGLGLLIFNDFILPIVEDVSNRVGVEVLYIFALPFEGLIRQYRKYDFRRLDPQHEAELHRRLKPRYDSECIFMYQML